MEQYIVIFDTNSYRDLVKGKGLEDTVNTTEELRKLENDKDIIRSGSVIVGMEMLAHLVEDGDDNGEECLYGLIAYGIHCSDQEKGIAIFPHASMHILNSYLNGAPEYLVDRVRNMSGIIVELKNDNETAVKKHKEQGTFLDIKTYIETEEQTFCNLLIELVTGITEEIKKQEGKISRSKLREKALEFVNNGSFEPMIAIAIISALADKYGVSLSNKERIERAYDFNMRFPTGVGFYRWIVSKIIYNRIDMTSNNSKKRRWNWMWDYNVCFALNDKLNQRDVLVVTSDGDMKEVAQVYGLGNRVLTLEEYYKFLQS